MCGANMGITFFSLVCGLAVILCGGKREKIANICSTMIACCVLKKQDILVAQRRAFLHQPSFILSFVFLVFPRLFGSFII